MRVQSPEHVAWRAGVKAFRKTLRRGGDVIDAQRQYTRTFFRVLGQLKEL